jgi:hypothetical protein
MAIAFFDAAWGKGFCLVWGETPSEEPYMMRAEWILGHYLDECIVSTSGRCPNSFDADYHKGVVPGLTIGIDAWGRAANQVMGW